MHIQDFIPLLVACKDDGDLINVKWLSCPKYFFSGTQGQIIAKLIIVSGQNGAYPENANFKTSAPRTLKFITFSGLHKTKKS